MKWLWIVLVSLLSFQVLAAAEEKYSKTEILDRPLMERYILDELKSLRMDLDYFLHQTSLKYYDENCYE